MEGQEHSAALDTSLPSPAPGAADAAFLGCLVPLGSFPAPWRLPGLPRPPPGGPPRASAQRVIRICTRLFSHSGGLDVVDGLGIQESGKDTLWVASDFASLKCKQFFFFFTLSYLVRYNCVMIDFVVQSAL